MSKTIKYATNGALIFGIGNALLNALKQHQRISENPNLEFDWSELLKATGKGALAGGAGGAVVGGIMDLQNASEEPLNTSAILGTVIANMKLDKDDPTYKKLSRKADHLINQIEVKFNNQLGGHILRIGSTEDNTALSDDFDIDVSIPFKPNSFPSTAVMYDELLQFLKNEYDDRDLIKVRTQKKSIGLIYRIKGEDYKIDVVPYKLTAGNGNKTAGYLFVNSNSIFGNDSYTKTDIPSLKSIKLSPVQQKLLVSFKNWKQKYSVPISSHLLRLLILDAYDWNKRSVPRDFTKKILMVVHHIRDNIMDRRIVSVENTNNVLTDMHESDKREIKMACEKIIQDYTYQPNSILKYFE
jgi:hypothetical protein